ncbi:MAG: hypothetical protein ACC619_00590 [Paracoccaceae bacterium]
MPKAAVVESVMKRLIAACRRRPLVGAVFLLAIVAAIFFGFRSVIFLVYWSDPEHRNLEIEGRIAPAQFEQPARPSSQLRLADRPANAGQSQRTASQ